MSFRPSSPLLLSTLLLLLAGGCVVPAPGQSASPTDAPSASASSTGQESESGGTAGGSNNGSNNGGDNSGGTNDGGTNDGGEDDGDEGNGANDGNGTDLDGDDLVLSKQLQLQEGGDGIRSMCPENDKTPASFAEDPGVWLNNLYSGSEYFELTALCLRGFDTDASIDLTVRIGDLRFETTVEPVDGAAESDTPLGYDEEPPATLFTGDRLRVYTEQYAGEPIDGPDGVLASEMWHFVPPAEVRDQLADVGSFDLNASQGQTEARATQQVAIPKTRHYYQIDRAGERKTLVLTGYPARARVPIGLYLTDPDEPRAALVERIGSVRMPASRIATFPIPSDFLAGHAAGTYCVLPRRPLSRTASTNGPGPTIRARSVRGTAGSGSRRGRKSSLQHRSCRRHQPTMTGTTVRLRSVRYVSTSTRTSAATPTATAFWAAASIGC